MQVSKIWANEGPNNSSLYCIAIFKYIYSPLIQMLISHILRYCAEELRLTYNECLEGNLKVTLNLASTDMRD